MVEIAHKHGMRIVGPNTQGLANFGTGAIASFSTMFTEFERVEGHVAMLSQERRAVHGAGRLPQSAGHRRPPQPCHRQ